MAGSPVFTRLPWGAHRTPAAHTQQWKQTESEKNVTELAYGKGTPVQPGWASLLSILEEKNQKMWQHVRKGGKIVMAQYSIELLMELPRRAILPCQLAVMSSKMFWIENDVWQQEFKGLWTTKHLDHNPRLEPGVSKAQGIYTNGLRPILMVAGPN